jgi:hypothetical protein
LLGFTICNYQFKFVDQNFDIENLRATFWIKEKKAKELLSTVFLIFHFCFKSNNNFWYVKIWSLIRFRWHFLISNIKHTRQKSNFQWKTIIIHFSNELSFESTKIVLSKLDLSFWL